MTNYSVTKRDKRRIKGSIYHGGTQAGVQRREAWINQRRKVSRGSTNHKDSATHSPSNMLKDLILWVITTLGIFLSIPAFLLLVLSWLLEKVAWAILQLSNLLAITLLWSLSETMIQGGWTKESLSRKHRSSLVTIWSSNPLKEEEEYYDKDLCMRHEHESREKW